MIAVEARALAGPSVGVRRYVRGLLTGLYDLDPSLALVLFTDRDFEPSALQHHLPRQVVPPSWPGLRLWWDTVALPAAVRRARAKLLHRTKPSGTPFTKGLPPVVTTIYDTIPLDHPEWQTLAQRTYWRLALPLAARRSTAILTISEYAKQRIVERLHVPPERIQVTYPGVDQPETPATMPALASLRRRYRLERPYLLAVGTIEPRKNLDVLIRAYGAVRSKLPHELVIAGRFGWKTDAVRAAAADPRVRDHVRFLGAVPSSDLPLLYGGADAFAFLSLDEGFGFPPLEAMACGTPTIVSGKGSLPEVAGTAALVVDPADLDAVAAALLLITSDAELRGRLVREGRLRSAEFTTVRLAAATLAVYRQVLGEI